MLCFVCDLLIPAWRVGQGSRERWWWRRLCEGGRGCVWKATGSRGGAVLQVRSIQQLKVSQPVSSPTPRNILTWVSLHCVSSCRQKEKEQMEALRKHHSEEIEHHKKEIERLQKEIDRHKGKIRKLKHDDWSYHFSSRESSLFLFAKSMMIKYWLINCWSRHVLCEPY